MHGTCRAVLGTDWHVPCTVGPTCSGVVCKHEFKGTSLRDVEGGSPGEDSWAVAQDPHRCHATYKRCGVNGQCVVNYYAVSPQQRRVPGGVTCP